ncbi:MAG TPA: hypothetical protein VNO18_08910 [Xanthobacteraceae bacterium]|jgi:hypothetical protein|nr:hypothetical protein [Xanthobacteraceae bacterium]
MTAFLRRFLRDWFAFGLAGSFGVDIALQRGFFERIRLAWQLYRSRFAKALSRAAFPLSAINRPLIFFGGVIVSGIVVVALAAAWEVWQAHSERLARRSIEYDRCLVLQAGNVAFCEALMRLRERERASKP